MSLYDKIVKQIPMIPDSFDMSYSQLCDIKENSPGISDAIYVSFVFGYMQGKRAERARKKKGSVSK